MPHRRNSTLPYQYIMYNLLLLILINYHNLLFTCLFNSILYTTGSFCTASHKQLLYPNTKLGVRITLHLCNFTNTVYVSHEWRHCKAWAPKILHMKTHIESLSNGKLCFDIMMVIIIWSICFSHSRHSMDHQRMTNDRTVITTVLCFFSKVNQAVLKQLTLH